MSERTKKIPTCDCRTAVYYKSNGVDETGEAYETGDLRYAGKMEKVEVDEVGICSLCGHFAVYVDDFEAVEVS